MTRLEANLKILDMLGAFLRANPDQRFCQALSNLGLPETVAISGEGEIRYVDKYYEESDKTLETVKERYAGMQPRVEYQWNPRSQRHEKVQV